MPDQQRWVAASAALDIRSTSARGNRRDKTTAPDPATAEKPDGYDGYGGVGSSISRSGSSVIGRGVHHVYLASQTAMTASAWATLISARTRAACGSSSRLRSIRSRAYSVNELNGPLSAQYWTIRTCSSVRFAVASWTASSSACQRGEPYSGGGAGRTASPLGSTQVCHVPPSGSTGFSTNPGGVGTQVPAPVNRPLPSHLASEPSALPRATARSPIACPRARPASTSLG